EFPADLKAVTRSKSVLADRSLELVGNYTDGPQLQPNDCVPLTNSYTPESISEIAGSAADLIDAVAPADGSASVQGSIEGMERALRDAGPEIADLLHVASSAAENPSRIVSDIGSIITNMAPLSSDALANWDAIEGILAVLPESMTEGANVLWPGTSKMPPGMTPIAAALYDIQINYGDEIWTGADSGAAAIHIAAGRVGEVQQASTMLPVLADRVRMISSPEYGAGLHIQDPKVRASTADNTALCRVLNGVRSGTCQISGTEAQLVEVGLFDLMLAGMAQ
ncbi:MAG: MCE family protein, partial [Rhodococcus sp. (in: high G+C Gram-positive bacteria)]|uniref:MCE family protein n=1 Tax=Rhodococcus sp. TaxID=1831 RepID=UPI003BAF91AA